MAWLNYQHLYYFWIIAREGGLSRAAKLLRLTHSTLSVQLRTLEGVLGAPLFDRRGRSLALTAFGREVQQFAGDIFRIGDELLELAEGQGTSRRRFDVGVVAAIPKTTLSELLAPAFASDRELTVRVRQDRADRLVQELAAGRLHAVMSDAPIVGDGGAKVHSHSLGSSEVLLYGRRELAARYRPGFPRSLEGAPLLLPGPDASVRRAIERWLSDRGVRVHVVGEVDDAGTLRALGAAGRGLFPVRAALRGEVERGLGVARVGTLAGVRESYFVISVERRITHPAVSRLIEAARRRLDEPRLEDAAPPPRRRAAARRRPRAR
jgi:LysR family transcriptional activator of nhaA